MNDLRILEARGRATILTDLSEKSMNISQLMEGYRGQAAVYRAKDQFMAEGLIEEEVRKNGAIFLILTDKGIRIAQHLLEIEKILKEK